MIQNSSVLGRFYLFKISLLGNCACLSAFTCAVLLFWVRRMCNCWKDSVLGYGNEKRWETFTNLFSYIEVIKVVPAVPNNSAKAIFKFQLFLTWHLLFFSCKPFLCPKWGLWTFAVSMFCHCNSAISDSKFKGFRLVLFVQNILVGQLCLFVSFYLCCAPLLVALNV